MAKYCPTRVVLFFCAAVCLLVPPGRLHAQISPGPLSKAHESLSGLTQCTTCHKLGTGGALKCLDCHGEIKQRLTLKQGFHAAVVSRESPDKDCVRCHSEHNGENFQLIRWEPSREKFDHAKTGYMLEGKHASLQCKQCHNAAFIQPPLRQLIRYKDLNKSFLGLSRSCLSCHKDFHQGQLGRDCQTCHSTNSWKEVTRFDHSRTRYPLTGRHATVACSKCHIPPGPGLSPKYRGLNFATCSACHADPHKGAFQKGCDSCHTTAGWKQLSAAGVSSQFDHDKTKFPLRGKHRGLDCAACHRSGNFKQPVPFALCSDCHKPDPHSGQFARRKDGGKCESCHTVDGWKPSTFTIQAHARSAYPLEGAHARVECARCHIPAGTATRFKIKFAHCTDCHKDAHGGQFAAAPLFNRCESCHTVKTFAPSTFTLAHHQKTRFPLLDSHLAVPCADCHEAKRRPGSPAPYHFAVLACPTCHADPHHGQFAAQMRAKGADGRAAGCEACHNVKDWKDLARFDHDQTAFRLLGAHKAVACMDCHKPPHMETHMRNVDFRAAPKVCESCHDDPHARQFARNGADPKCNQCHNSTRWRPSLFDHEKTAFPLKGAHQNVRCSACHKNVREVNGKQVLFYQNTPKECAACHGAIVPL